MKILIVGSGAREHALAWKLGQSGLVSELSLWPGNPAMAGQGHIWELPKDADHPRVVAECIARAIDLVCVGPEGPLAAGLVDDLTRGGIKAFGPCAAAAQLEASKVFSKSMMLKAGIPTAAHVVVDDRASCERVAYDWLAQHGGVVLKASGLAAGKGVFVCEDKAAVANALYRLYETEMVDAASSVVVEELLRGREVSHFSLIGNKSVESLGFAVDHKRLQDGDRGPNTGGMGCYTPVPWLPANADQTILDRIVHPLLATMMAEGHPYEGFLYTGIMWTQKGPYVIEFNVRLGDPEAQVLAVSDERDWVPMMLAALAGDHAPPQPTARMGSARAAVSVVIAAAGYPYEKDMGGGKALALAEFSAHTHHAMVFGASVAAGVDGIVHTGSGRVLSVVGSGLDMTEARTAAYQRVTTLVEQWPGAQYRTDIAAPIVANEGKDSSQ